MEYYSYSLIEYGIDPCILKRISNSWLSIINTLDNEFIGMLQYRMINTPLSNIIMMILDIKDLKMVSKMLNYVSIPLIQWNTVSYLIEDIDIAKLIHNRIRNVDTNEMARRLGLPMKSTNKDNWRIGAIINNRNSIVSINPMQLIISNGNIDMLESIITNASILENIDDILSGAIDMLKVIDKPINGGIIRWLSHTKYNGCIPDEIINLSNSTYNGDTMIRLSLDIPYRNMENIPLYLLHMCGRKILDLMMKRDNVCERYLRSKYRNIRVLDAMIRYQSHNEIIYAKAISLIDQHEWNEYISIQ